MEIISLKDLVPAATCSVNTKFIMLEKGKITHEKDKKCLALVADETASVHFQLWGTECEAFEPGDIIQLTKGICIFIGSHSKLLIVVCR
ncbi:SOSS complex subunit B1 [Zostera marina]|uniref:SOSS complex subunit B1 n=1 Tax=Zostera marina TaxID=29655 RepID=A0A0K9NN33_ZOSMR|nr:SOSS complex subunit B1 [Zostera marina]